MGKKVDMKGNKEMASALPLSPCPWLISHSKLYHLSLSS